MSLLAGFVLAAAGTASLMPPGWSVLCPPKSRPDEIVVCADREPAQSPYRAPLPVLRDIGERGTASVSAERNKFWGRMSAPPARAREPGAQRGRSDASIMSSRTT